MAAALLLASCSGDAAAGDPAGPIDAAPLTGEGPTACMPENAASEWSFAALGSGAKPALALGTDGTVHAAFMYEAQSGWIRYARLRVGDMRAGTLEAIDAGYFYGPIDIVLDSNDQPMVLYHDHTLEDQVLALRDAAASWSLHPMLNTGHDGWYNAGAVDATGTLHTATYDPSGFSGQGVMYGAWDGVTWAIDVAAPGSFDYAGGMAIVLTASGGIHIAFFDDVARQARITTRPPAGAWDVTTIEAIGGELETGRFPDLARRRDSARGIPRAERGNAGCNPVR